MSNRTRWAVGFLAVVLFTALAYAFTSLVYWRGVASGVTLQDPMIYPDQYVYPRAWTLPLLAPGVPEPTGFSAVYGPNAVGQQFQSCCDRLAMVRVWLGGAAGQRVVLSLRTSPDRADTLYVGTLDLERDGYHVLVFPVERRAANEVYYFFVEAPDATRAEAVALRAVPTERVGGMPLLNEYSASGNLDFATYHRGAPGWWLLAALGEQVFPAAASMRLQQYKPLFFKGNTFEVLFAVTVVGALAWLAVSWPGERRPVWWRRALGVTAVAFVLATVVAVLGGVVLWPVRRVTAQEATVAASDGGGTPRLVYDLLLDLYPAGREPQRRFFTTTWRHLDGRKSPCVVVPPNSKLSYSIGVPFDARLDLEMALDAPGAPGAQSARRHLEAALGSGKVLFSREIVGSGAARASIDLSPYGGHRIKLVLRTTGDESGAPGLWCNPQIVSAHAWLLPYPLAVRDEEGIYLHESLLGDALELVGYGLELTELPPGDSLVLSLYWHARQRVTDDYTVFVHLLNEQGKILAQHDGQPVYGTYPTSLWSPADVVVDRHVLSIPPGLPGGKHILAVGLYDLATLQRLPAVDETGTPWPDGRILSEFDLE